MLWRRCAFGCVFVLGLAAGALGAGASPLDDAASNLLPFSGPSSDGAAMVATNPAGLMRLPWGWYVEIGGTSRLEQYRVDRTLTDPLSGDVTEKTAQASPFSAGGSIAFFLTSRRVSVAFRGPTLAAGERPMTGSQTAPFASDGSLQAISWVGGAVSIAPISRLLIGVLGELTQTRAHLTFGQDTALLAGRDPARGLDSTCGTSRCGLEHPLALSNIDINLRTRDVNWAFTIGGQLRVGEASWLGVAYRIPPGGFSSPVSLSGTATIEAAPRDGAVTTSTSARLQMYMPHWLTLSYVTPLGSAWTALADLRLTYFQGAGDYNLRLYGNGFPEERGWIYQPRSYRDTARLSLGVEQVDSGQPLILGLRATLDTGATAPSQIAPSHIEPPSATLAAGARVRLTPYIMLDVGYGFRAYRPANAAGSQFDPSDAVACQDSGYDYSTGACAQLRDGYAIASGLGDYRRFTHVLRASLRLTLR